MTWKFAYDPETDKTTVEWREYSETFDGEITSRIAGYPASYEANEAVNTLLQSINSIPEGLEAVAEFQPGMIEYIYPDEDNNE